MDYLYDAADYIPPMTSMGISSIAIKSSPSAIWINYISSLAQRIFV